MEDGAAPARPARSPGALPAEPPACGCGGAGRRRAATGGLPHRRSRQKPPRSRRAPCRPPPLALAAHSRSAFSLPLVTSRSRAADPAAGRTASRRESCHRASARHLRESWRTLASQPHGTSGCRTGPDGHVARGCTSYGTWLMQKTLEKSRFPRDNRPHGRAADTHEPLYAPYLLR